mmetsp:Transcript_63972/g.73391  ORF Transcript_63972/g.73391 Transcript_63972/m.73391 type:complete len:89 (-) Transcript_63972:961-1227(-)
MCLMSPCVSSLESKRHTEIFTYAENEEKGNNKVCILFDFVSGFLVLLGGLEKDFRMTREKRKGIRERGISVLPKKLAGKVPKQETLDP